MSEDSTTRRSLLQGAGIGLGALVVGTGSASARGRQEYNVGTATPAAEYATRNAAADIARVFEWTGDKQTLTVTLPAKAAQNLRRRADVRYVERNGAMWAIGQTLPWGINRIDAEAVHADGQTGGDSTDGEGGGDIAIIDTGIDDDHPDLQANVGTGKAYAECTGSNCNYTWSDDNNHGTHCAGIADAADNSTGVVGVSTGATLHSVKVLDGDGRGTFSDVAAGIKYTADQGWDVGSLSLGASSGSSTVKDACQYATDNGVLLVAAAGNSGPCTDCVGYPAAYSTVVAVSSTDSDDSLSSFSSTGSEVELAAPGGRIYSTVIGGYQTYSGTSMACPHVAGAGAQLMDNGYTNTEARERLTATAEDIGLPSNEQGNGLLDAEAAVSGSTDSAPAVSWVTPTAGDSVSGTVTVQVNASDSEDSDDSLAVTYRVDGGTSRSTTYNSTTGYYEDTWDSTIVADGDHTLATSATDSAGTNATSSIAITTDNTESAPSVDSLAVVEVETSDGDAVFDADWSVSDSDGNLDAVDVVLTQESDDSTEDSKSVNPGGDTASDTTRLVATGDEGTDNSYTVAVTVTDGAGKADSATVATTESERAPTVDSLAAAEVETSDGDAAFDVSWTVGDADGDLDSLDLSLTDDTDGERDDASTVSVSGSTDSGMTQLVAAGDDGSGNNYTVDATVTDSFGNTGSGSASVSETEQTKSAPTVDSYTVTEAGSPNPHAEITADWNVGDTDGNLDTVVVEVLDSAETVVGASTTSVSGSDATGTDEFQVKHSKRESFDVTLTVTDAAGESTAATRTVTE